MLKLRRLLRSLNKFNAIPYVFLAFFVRCTITGASLGDSFAALAICALVGVKLYLDSLRKPDISRTVFEELRGIKDEVAMLKMNGSSKKMPSSAFVPRPDQRLF